MVSIIIINYNGYKDTCELVDSLHNYEIYPYEIIVVDNASKGQDGNNLQEKYPDITVVCSMKNLGFAGGNNLGNRYAKGDYILYMNNDMLIDAPFLEALVDKFESSDKIGLVSPKIKYAYAKDTIQYAGYTEMIPVSVRNNLIGVNEKDNGMYDLSCKTAFAHGACMLTSRKLIEKIGQMTEVYFLFYEELDWSLQFRRAGYEIWYEPSSCVYHKESMTIKRGTAIRQYYLTRNRNIFIRRNYLRWEKWLACCYQIFISLPKKLSYFFNKRKIGHVQSCFERDLLWLSR